MSISLRNRLKIYEQRLFRKALIKTKFNLTRAAELLRISRVSMYKRLVKLDLLEWMQERRDQQPIRPRGARYETKGTSMLTQTYGEMTRSLHDLVNAIETFQEEYPRDYPLLHRLSEDWLQSLRSKALSTLTHLQHPVVGHAFMRAEKQLHRPETERIPSPEERKSE